MGRAPSVFSREDLGKVSTARQSAISALRRYADRPHASGVEMLQNAFIKRGTGCDNRDAQSKFLVLPIYNYGGFTGGNKENSVR